MGGEDDLYRQSGKVYGYDAEKDLWSVIGDMATPRSYVLIAILPSGEQVVVGGCKKTFMKTCEIVITNYVQLPHC